MENSEGSKADEKKKVYTLAWLKIDQALTNHKKTLKLSCELDISMSHAVGLMVTLWLWALDNAPDGSLSDIQAPLLARVLDWRGEPTELLKAMQNAGFLDGDQIHDWDEYAGKLIDQRVAAKIRAKKSRNMPKAVNSENVDSKCSASSTNIREACAYDTRNISVVHKDVATQTRLDNTIQDKTIRDQENILPPQSPNGGSAAPINKIHGERFDEFWKAYPKKVGKEAARKSWMKLKPTTDLFNKIISAVENAKKSKQWQKERGQYIPNPATWLNQGRWDDELEPEDRVKPESQVILE